MKKVVMMIGVLMSVLPCIAGIADEWALLPSPQEIKLTGQGEILGSEFAYVQAKDCKMPMLYGNLDRLPQCPRPGRGVFLEIDTISAPDSPEGYILTVNPDGATVKARAEAGLMYGCITLDQLITQSQEHNKPIPAMEIIDYPKIDFRAVHVDTKHHLDRMDYYYSLIDRLAQWKVNAVIWEIEDKLRFERRPEVAAPNAISKQEMQALSRYAHERNVEINPLVQGLGHAGFILKHHWELRENPKSDWEFCPSDPRTYELQFDLYRDALEAMPYGKYLHVGGDEITAIGIDERCKSTGMSPFELQMMWLQRVCDFAKENGRTPIFWDDMPFKYAGLWRVAYGGLTDEEVEQQWNSQPLDQAVELFPKDCVYMRWQYGDPDYLAHRKMLDWYSHNSLKVMGATAAADGGSPFMPRFGSKTPHIHSFCKMAEEYGLEGIFATAWDDGSPHSETFTRGYAALGEWGWNPSARTEKEFKQAHAQREFGLQPDDTDFIELLETSAYFFDGALVDEGRRNPAWGATDFKIIALPDLEKPGEWSCQYSSRLDSARIQMQRYVEISNKISHAQQNALRNRYTLDIYAQNNELFQYPAKLLLALECLDNSNSESERKQALENLQQVVNDFDEMRENLEAVYSRTRFISNPNGYIADMNHHNHLAALAQDGSWLYLYEIALINAIKARYF